MRGRSGHRGSFGTAAILALVTLTLAPACNGFSTGDPADAAPIADPADQSAGRFTGRVGDGGGEIVADSGFRPESHGFTFENYGKVLSDGSTVTNLTPADVRTMFGDAVCRDASATRCDLIPEAEAWLEETNAEMSLGHCYGFAVASSLLWERTITPSTFGAVESSQLAIDDNEALQRRIAYDWATQLLESVRAKVVLDSPNKVLDTLKRSLEPNPAETYTIVLWKPDGTGGHAVTPFAVEDRGDGKFGVLIYDNNWPGETRIMDFDQKANTWSYDASINPDQPDEIYKGTAKTQNVALFPASPGLGVQKCPFCGKRDQAAAKGSGSAGAAPTAGATGAAADDPPMQEIFLRASDMQHADLLITDDAGRRLGFVDGKLVQEIAGARVDRLLANQDWRATTEPHFVVPADRRYVITLDAGRLGHDDVETLGVIGPAFDVSVRDIHVDHGDRNVLAVDLNGESISYSTSRAQTPTILIAVSEEEADYGFAIRGLSEEPGTKIHVRLPIDAGTLSINDEGSGATSKVHLKMRRYDSSGVEDFEPHVIPLAGEGTAELHYGGFTGAAKDEIPLVIKRQGRTTTTLLKNDAIPSRS